MCLADSTGFYYGVWGIITVLDSCAVSLISTFVVALDGYWQRAPIEKFGADLDKFERGLFNLPLIGDELRGLGCFGEYIQGALVNKQNTDEVILEVFCGSHTAWIFMDGLPPKDVETYFQNPTL